MPSTNRIAAVLAAFAATATATTAIAPAAAQPTGTVAAVRERGPDLATRRPARRHGRMAVEVAAMLGVGTAWYWRRDQGQFGGANVVDWQLGFHGSSFAAKMSLSRDGWRFDGNSYGLNAVGHPMFGAMTYFMARTNHYTVGESFLISTLASGAWETFTEWAEYGSINDMLATSTTGVPLGEAAYQLAHHWRKARFVVATGAGSEAGATIGSIGVGAALDTSPRAGEGWLAGGRKVSAGLEVALDGGVRSVEGRAKSSLVGYHRAGPGYQLFAGATTAFEYRDRKDRDGRPWDLLTTIGAGPTVEARLERGGVTIAAGVDVHAQFGMVRAQAYDAWRAMNPAAIVRNSMQDKPRPYYYAGAIALEPRIAVAYRGLDVGGDLTARRLDSLDGADRDQEMMTADPGIHDTDVSASAWAGYSRAGMRLAVQGRIRHRAGSMDDARGEASDRTTMLSLSYER